MYEMYPQAWAVGTDGRQGDRTERPRRRPRKEHSVVPAVLLRHSELLGSRQLAG